jgi:dipeptidyl aminopeptidase/acylaminoacyl peptidase
LTIVRRVASAVGPIAVVALISCSATETVNAASPPQHLVTLSDMDSLGSGDVTLELSPDGRKLIYADSSGVRVTATKPGREARKLGSGFLPSWSPPGDRIAYYSVTEDGIQLKVVSPGSWRERQVTGVRGGIDPDPSSRIRGRTTDAFRYSWAPNGRKIAFSSRVRAKDHFTDAAARSQAISAENRQPGTPLILTNSTPPAWTLMGLFSKPDGTIGLGKSLDGHSVSAQVNVAPRDTWVSQLFIVTVDTGEVVQLTNSDMDYFAPAWSPDGRTILCAGTLTQGSVFGVENINIYQLDALSGKATAITHEPGVRWLPSWSTSGRDIAYLGSDAFFSMPSVFVGHVSDLAFANATKKLDRYIDEYRWDARRQSLVVTYKDGVSDRMRRIALDGSGAVTPLTTETSQPLTFGDISVDATGGVAWSQRDPSNAETIRYVSSRRKGATEVVNLNPQVKQWTLGQVNVIRWKNHRGDDLEGAVLLPPNYKIDQRYPVIVDAYPVSDATGWLKPMYGNQAWAALGYAVFRPSPRAPHSWVNPWTTESASLEAKGPRGWDVTVDDVLSGVDSLVRNGIADPDRMCLYGFSNGAGVVNYLVTRTPRFKCAVSVAPALSDWVRPSLLDTSQADYLTTWAGTSLWDDPEVYVELSAVFHLKSVKTPMLLAAGDNDGNFLLDAIEMYNGLREMGLDVTLLRYPDQEHGFTGASLRDFWARELNFFSSYLGPAK